MQWETKKLEDVADFYLGKMLDKKKNKGDYRPYLANVNVRWGGFELDDLREMRFEDREKERYGLEYGDIVMCEGGEPGRCAIWKNQIPGMMFQKALHRIRPNATLDYRFLYYSFLNRGQEGGFDQYCTGATIKHLPRQNLAKVEVPVPPLETQQAIASILSAYDDLIENNTRRIEILEEMARRLYEEWFVHFRFPGHEEVSFKESELGDIPEGWEVRRLEDTVALNPRTKVPKEGEKLFVPMGALSESSMIVGSLERKPGNSGAKFQNGDTLFARITPCLENGKTGFVDFLPEDQPTACGSTEFIVLRSVSLCPEMVYLLARSDRFRDVAIKSMSGATGRQRVRLESLVEFPVVQPDNATLEAFQRFVSPCFKQARTLALKNSNLRAQRDLLLPKLVSGEIEVSEVPIPDDKEVEAA
ncbi:restriction endonuclease subunit S [Klebsiella pneumoniae]|uniref:restriction endonuclease subunit S n=1 Tax=Klebsiella pneumoniae TaxID=573 RepID=UPI00240E2492|nr:restriction endonuclease subunit S [Klebsiella pneumoniae]MDV0975884.1 restriction endonuclease subunit S [Klebsiella pneumoniae]WFA71410.1 restriction endonuclease subunit S [Klebsiella pneumoniae]HDG8034354.1 restriction endonuclease subunit S [Klebsiella pneumoniae]